MEENEKPSFGYTGKVEAKPLTQPAQPTRHTMKTIYVDGIPISVKQRAPRAVRQRNVPRRNYEGNNSYEGVKMGYEGIKKGYSGIKQIGSFLSPESRIQRIKNDLKNRKNAEKFQIEEGRLKTELEEQKARDKINRPNIAQKAGGIIGGLFKKKKENIYSRNSGGDGF